MGHIYGTKWTEDEIREGILEVVSALKLDRMPSRKEVVQHYNGSGLSEKISKEPGGWYKWADRLNLPIKESETGLGKKYESAASDTLIAIGHEAERMSQNFPYDILVDGAVKVDVKASHLYKGTNGNFYTFNLEKKFCTCDIYILYLIGEVDEKDRTLIIPSAFVAKNTQISVGQANSIYYKYLERWDYVDAYSEFFNNSIRSMA